MSNYDWSKFSYRININAPIQKLYNAFTTKDSIQNWFLRLSEFKRNGELMADHEMVKDGDTYEWFWFGYDDSVSEKGTIVKANDKDELQFTFGNYGNVTIKVYEEDNESIVELTQDHIPLLANGASDIHVGCSTGWVFYLANLKSIMEGGIDLRNKNVLLKRMLNS